MRSHLLAWMFLAGTLMVPGLASADEPIVPGDQVWIIIPGPIDFDKKFVVNADGQVDLGFYGKLRISGRTEAEALSTLQLHLQQYLRNTSGVFLKVHTRGTMVLVTGKVKNPGLITMPAKADLYQALQKAGGPDRGADLSRVILIRQGVEHLVDVRAFLTREAQKPIPRLESGDTVFVPADAGYPMAEEGRTAFLSNTALDRKIFVLGAVVAPGMYDRGPDMDPLTALGLAGGPTRLADLANARLLTRNSSRVLDLSGRLAGTISTPQSLPPDGAAILFVPFAAHDQDDRMLQQINIIGGVQRPGRLSVSGPILLVDAISLAGGPTREADLSDVRLVKAGRGFTLATRYDLQRFTKEGGLAVRVMIHAGDTVYVDPDRLDIWGGTLQVISDIAIIATAVALLITLGG